MQHAPNFNHLNEEQKLNLLHQLVRMAKADKIFKFVEFKYLTEIAELLNISTRQLDEIIENEVVAPIPKNIGDRTRQLYRLSVMMMIDHIISKEEMAVLKEYAIELKLNPEHVDVMIKRMHENKGGMLLEKDLFEIFNIEAN